MAYIKEQYSLGTQGDEKKLFWALGLKTCVKCGAPISAQTDVCGVRMNGDGYGVENFKCTKCEWSTSFQYDEGGDLYYYDTRFWKRDEILEELKSK